MKGAELKLSGTLLDNFSKKLTIFEVLAIKKISNNSELNFSELIEKLAYYSLAQLFSFGVDS